jgi:hypothetical protein
MAELVLTRRQAAYARNRCAYGVERRCHLTAYQHQNTAITAAYRAHNIIVTSSDFVDKEVAHTCVVLRYRPHDQKLNQMSINKTQKP